MKCRGRAGRESDPSVDAAVIAHYRSGGTLRKTAKAFGMSHENVRLILNAHHIEPNVPWKGSKNTAVSKTITPKPQREPNAVAGIDKARLMAGR